MKHLPSVDSSRKWSRRKFLYIGAATTVSVVTYGCLQESEELLEIYHLPKKFTRRAGELTANICGSLSSQTESARYRLNQSDWQGLPQGEPRVPEPLFTIEIKASDLLEGENILEIEVKPKSSDALKTLKFQLAYDPTPIQLPLKMTWSSSSDLDVQDGRWETFEIDGEWRVRPKPGFEEYDRILNVTGAFSGGRRIETDLVFRDTGWLGWRGKRAYGFGLLTLWGGHLEMTDVRPRRGWLYGLGWFYAPRRSPEQEHDPGLVLEFSSKVGDEKNEREFEFFPSELKKDVRYSIVTEAVPVLSKAGKYLYWKQRLKWWDASTPEPDQWLEAEDNKSSDSLLPNGEYAVSLLTHRTQVEFGSVIVKPLESIVIDS